MARQVQIALVHTHCGPVGMVRPSLGRGLLGWIDHDLNATNFDYAECLFIFWRIPQYSV
jgi:hypothetical protein